MIRCRCGTWTDYGMTCTMCADAWNKTVVDDGDEEVELVSLDEGDEGDERLEDNES